MADTPPILKAFQLTASRRGWRQTQLMRWAASGNFNSQPHEEADARATWLQEQIDISTHSLTKRLTMTQSALDQYALAFQLTASRRGWQSSTQEKEIRYYFNSQPHEEADGGHRFKSPAESISTHSLTKRLTIKVFVIHTFLFISTHSLTKRLTVTQYRGYTMNTYFNSQPHEEADGAFTDTDWIDFISTHSLTKRLT